jgi:hypothetical protein
VLRLVPPFVLTDTQADAFVAMLPDALGSVRPAPGEPAAPSGRGAAAPERRG